MPFSAVRNGATGLRSRVFQCAGARWGRIGAACLLALFGLQAVACGGGQLGALTYGDRAQANYAAALDDFYDEDCLIAQPAFNEIRRNFPYSRFAALSELRAADCQMMQGQYAEAVASYRQFIRYHPSHVEVPFAHFQVALAHFEQIPSEWLLSPPNYERDQHFTQQALRLLRRFILDHPGSPLVGRAQQMVQDAVHILAEHELYVADFYTARDKPKAAAGRLRTLLRSYPGSGFEPQALLRLGDTYRTLKEPARAQAAYRELLDRFPKSEQALQARARP